MNWYFKVLRDYATFEGRATRQEYWMFYLFNLLAMILSFLPFLLSTTTDDAGLENMQWLLLPIFYLLGTFIPWIALTARRLHDVNLSGWWQLLTFLPFGTLVLFVFTVLDGTVGTNIYGNDPKGRGDSTVDTHLDTLERLYDLLQKGVITQEEFETQKAILMGKS
jgi:uncharacterized membrane protein YhaH (DUF805 family)